MAVCTSVRTLKIFLIVLFLTSTFTIAANTHSKKPFQHCGRLKVVGLNLCSSNGYPIQLRGMSTHGLQWFENCITDQSLDVLVNEWGADILRVSMYVHEDGYLTKPAYFRNLIDKIVDMTLQRGIYCLLDWHQLTPGDPNADIDSAKTFFQYMSSKHGSKGHVLYDICNEPNGSKVTWQVISNYANAIIPIIRKNDPQSVIIVGTPTWASRPDLVIGAKLNFDNLLYTMHFYAADHQQEYRDNMTKAIQGGIPVFVTEFGTQEASGDGGNDFTSSQAWMDLLAKHKISWTNWNYSDDKRSGAVWKLGTAKSGQWTDANLKEAGVWIKNHISNPADDFGPTALSPSPQTNGNSFTVNVHLTTGNDKMNSFSFSLPYSVWRSSMAGNMQLMLYCAQGRNVYTLAVQPDKNGTLAASVALPWQISAGMYVASLRSERNVLCQKMITLIP
ncbi:MAG: glycoside hydrolase family 5 protein [Chitinivibrionales bacterium]|nr:glycoside hydrolase family 5 protein [Chitinivibrionales bacterium]